MYTKLRTVVNLPLTVFLVLATLLPMLAAVSAPRAAKAQGDDLEICKELRDASGLDASLADTEFVFTIDEMPGMSWSLFPGECTAPIDVPGDSATVREQYQPGVIVADITALGGSQGNTNRLISRNMNPDPDANTLGVARVAVVEGETTLVTFTDAVLGYIQICKEASDTNDPLGYLTNNDFRFRINGRDDTYSLGIGECTDLIPVPYGQVTVRELPDTGTMLTDVEAEAIQTGDNMLVSWSASGRWAIINVVAGDETNETVVTFYNAPMPTGVLKVCKTVSGAYQSLLPFYFTVRQNGNVLPDTNGAAPGNLTVRAGRCVIYNGGMRFLMNTRLSVSEELPYLGFYVNDISTNPAGALLSENLGSMYSDAVALVAISANVTTVTFNDVGGFGALKICKINGGGVPSGTAFRFLITNEYGTWVRNIRVGYCNLLRANLDNDPELEIVRFPLGTPTMVDEATNGYSVTNITYSPWGASPPAPYGGIISTDLGAGTANVRIGRGINVLRFTNSGGE